MPFIIDADDMVVANIDSSDYPVHLDFQNINHIVTCVNFLSTAQDDILDAIAGSPVHQMILGLLSGDKELATLAAQSVADAILGDEPGLIWKEKVT